MIKNKNFIIFLIGFLLLLACEDSNNIIVEEPEEVVEIPIVEEPIVEEPENNASDVLSEIVLESDGAGETYELINSVFAPNYNVVEAPDCSHESFGRHIAVYISWHVGAFASQV